VRWGWVNRASSLRKWALWCPQIDGVCFRLQRSRSVGRRCSFRLIYGAGAKIAKKVMHVGDLPVSDLSGVGW
jgi:hypothetical protein